MIFSEAWTDLSDQVKVQAQKLHGAMEIHRFNRDVEDALYRIREKYGSIPDELGRDVKQVQKYQKKHEAFENELAALEAQLQVLVDDSARLQEAYPGGNADQIEQQQQIVVENWTILQEKAAKRRDDLQAALDLYRFLASVSNNDNVGGGSSHYPSSTYYWFCIMYKSRFSCSLGSLARLSTLL